MDMAGWIHAEVTAQAEVTDSDFDAAFDAVLVALRMNLYADLTPERRDAAIGLMTQHQAARLAFGTMYGIERARAEGRDCCASALQDRLEMLREETNIPARYFDVAA